MRTSDLSIVRYSQPGRSMSATWELAARPLAQRRPAGRDTFTAPRAAGAGSVGLAVVLASAAAGYGETAGGRSTRTPSAAATARAGPQPEGRERKLPPETASPQRVLTPAAYGGPHWPLITAQQGIRFGQARSTGSVSQGTSVGGTVDSCKQDVIRRRPGVAGGSRVCGDVPDDIGRFWALGVQLRVGVVFGGAPEAVLRSQNTDHCCCSRTTSVSNAASSGAGRLVMRVLLPSGPGCHARPARRRRR